MKQDHASDPLAVKFGPSIGGIRLDGCTPETFAATVIFESETQSLIAQECDALCAMLLEKNRKYGDSAINPQRIFSKADPIEQINVRIDDKLSRIKSAQDDDIEDTEMDLIGYLILKRVARRDVSK